MGCILDVAQHSSMGVLGWILNNVRFKEFGGVVDEGAEGG